MMTATDDSSRLKASPRMLVEVNSTISPAMTPDRPYTRAIPSPTSSTRPTSRTSWPDPRPVISRWRTETISSGLNFIAAPRQQLIADGLDPVPDRAVEHLVADLDDHPAQKGLVHLGRDDRVEPGGLADRLVELLGLGVRQRDGRPDRHPDALGPLVHAAPVGGGHVTDEGQPVLGVEHVQEVEQQVADVILERML